MVPFDAAIVTHGKDTISSKLTNALSRVQVWLWDLCLIMLNTKKTVCMVFSKQSTKLSRWHVFWREWNWCWHHTSKSSGLHWTLNSHLKNTSKRCPTQFNSACWTFVKLDPSSQLKLLNPIYTVWFSLTKSEFWSTVWSFTGSTVLQHLVQLYKKAIKVFGKKPQSYHHKIL